MNIGLGNEVGKLKLNLSKSGCDDSFLTPDEGDLNTYETINVSTLSHIIEKFDIDTNNLFFPV